MCKENEKRKTFLEDLPRKNGKYNKIDWKKSIGCKVKFIYDNIEGEIKIVNYESKGQYLFIEYKNKSIFKIKTGSFTQCNLRFLLKEEIYYKEYTYDETNSKIVDLRGLPLGKKGIDWIQVAKNKIKIPFVYGDIKGEVTIVDYKNDYIYLNYLNEEYFKINTGNFTKCRLGKLLGKVTGEFKIEIGTRFVDEKRDITIINREYRTDKGKIKRKYYQYKCNICGFCDDRSWLEESVVLNQKQGCSCCHGITVVEGINDIPTTAPWMVKYFQGGYDEAKLYSYGSGQDITPICPDCGRIKDKPIKIANIYTNHSIGCICNDSVSYPEKFLSSVLQQLINDKFEYQKTFDWSKNVKHSNSKLCGNKKYDFYFEINNDKYIIETHGLQHYQDGFKYFKGKTLEEEQENDRLKKELALQNGIKEENYIIIDCRKSELEWIRDNDNGILHSRLKDLFDLSNIDWLQCSEYALTNLVKNVCEIKRINPDMTCNDITQLIKISIKTVRRYLKQGTELGWCYYNAKEETIKSARKNGKSGSKPIAIFKDGIKIGEFESATNLDKNSKELFGIKLEQTAISAMCNWNYNTKNGYKGFTFKYI